MSSSENIVTAEARLSYLHVWKARPFSAGDEPKFSVALVFEKTQDLSSILKAHAEVVAADGAQLPNNASVQSPFVDGAVKYPGDPYYADKWILNCNQSEEYPPEILDANQQEIINRSDLYSGCYGKALVSFYGYFQGSKGISCSLHGIMKTRDGEALSAAGSVDAKKAFGAAMGNAPAAGSPPPPAAGTATPTYQAGANLPAGATIESYVTSGWTEQQMIDGGIILQPTAPPPAPPAANSPPPPPANQPPPPPAQPQFQPGANMPAGGTVDSYIESGWTEDQMRAGGIIV